MIILRSIGRGAREIELKHGRNSLRRGNAETEGRPQGIFASWRRRRTNGAENFVDLGGVESDVMLCVEGDGGRDGVVVLKMEGSAFLNGSQVSGSNELRDGDVLQFEEEGASFLVCIETTFQEFDPLEDVRMQSTHGHKVSRAKFETSVSEQVEEEKRNQSLTRSISADFGSFDRDGKQSFFANDIPRNVEAWRMDGNLAPKESLKSKTFGALLLGNAFCRLSRKFTQARAKRTFRIYCSTRKLVRLSHAWMLRMSLRKWFQTVDPTKGAARIDCNHLEKQNLDIGEELKFSEQSAALNMFENIIQCRQNFLKTRALSKWRELKRKSDGAQAFAFVLNRLHRRPFFQCFQRLAGHMSPARSASNEEQRIVQAKLDELYSIHRSYKEKYEKKVKALNEDILLANKEVETARNGLFKLESERVGLASRSSSFACWILNNRHTKVFMSEAFGKLKQFYIEEKNKETPNMNEIIHLRTMNELLQKRLEMEITERAKSNNLREKLWKTKEDLRMAHEELERTNSKLENASAKLETSFSEQNRQLQDLREELVLKQLHEKVLNTAEHSTMTEDENKERKFTTPPIREMLGQLWIQLSLHSQHQAVRRFLQRKIVFKFWKEFVRSNRKRRRIIRRLTLLDHCTRIPQLWYGFALWKDAVLLTNKAVSYSIIPDHVSRVREAKVTEIRITRKYFRAWKKFKSKMVEVRVLAEKKGARIRGDVIRNCFRGWMQQARSDCSNRKRMLPVAKRQYRHQLTRFVFDALKCHLESRRKLRVVYRAWKLHVARRRLQRGAIVRFIRRKGCNTLLSKTFRRWISFKARKRQVKIKRKAVAFGAWAGWMAQSKQRLDRRRLVKCFRRWKSRIESRKIMAGVFQRIFTRNRHVRIWWAFKKWVRFNIDDESERMKTKLGQRKITLLRRIIMKQQRMSAQRALISWRGNAKLARATMSERNRMISVDKLHSRKATRSLVFKHWDRVVRERFLKAERMHAAFERRRAFRTIGQVFRTWINHVVALRKVRRFRNHHERLLLKRVFSLWYLHCSGAHGEQKVADFRQNFRNRLFVESFRNWKRYSVRRIKARALINSLSKKWRHFKLVRAWQELFQDFVKKKEAVKSRKEVEEKIKSILEKTEELEKTLLKPEEPKFDHDEIGDETFAFEDDEAVERGDELLPDSQFAEEDEDTVSEKKKSDGTPGLQKTEELLEILLEEMKNLIERNEEKKLALAELLVPGSEIDAEKLEEKRKSFLEKLKQVEQLQSELDFCRSCQKRREENSAQNLLCLEKEKEFLEEEVKTLQRAAQREKEVLEGSLEFANKRIVQLNQMYMSQVQLSDPNVLPLLRAQIAASRKNELKYRTRLKRLEAEILRGISQPQPESNDNFKIASLEETVRNLEAKIADLETRARNPLRMKLHELTQENSGSKKLDFSKILAA